MTAPAMTAPVLEVDASSGQAVSRPPTAGEALQRRRDEDAGAAANRQDQARADARADAREKLRTATTVAQLRDALLVLLGPS